MLAAFSLAVQMLQTRMLTFSVMISLLAGPVIAGTPYDGVWDVTVETRTGSCDPSAQFRLTVQDGKVSGAANITGTVAHEGMVKVTLNGAYAFGQLDGHAGSGRWNTASAGKPCSGHWQATKSSIQRNGPNAGIAETVLGSVWLGIGLNLGGLPLPI
jgi:hypothetical protein